MEFPAPEHAISRRALLAGLGCSVASMGATESPEPAPAILDSHLHVWNLKQFHLPWLDHNIPVLSRDYSMADYGASIDGLGIVQTVYVEVNVEEGQQREEASYVSALCKQPVSLIGAGVAAGDPRSPTFAQYISPFGESSPAMVTAGAKVAALLDPKPNPELRDKPYDQKPYWNIERTRIGDTRTAPVELIVNGHPVARKTIVADGKLQDIEFPVRIERSSWVALRILPSSHTNPVFVLVGGKPIRASRRSAEWCLKGVDQCWSQKQSLIASAEMKDAEAAYEHARQAYRQILSESDAD